MGFKCPQIDGDCTQEEKSYLLGLCRTVVRGLDLIKFDKEGTVLCACLQITAAFKELGLSWPKSQLLKYFY